MAHVRQSRPDYGLIFQVEDIQLLQVVSRWELGSQGLANSNVADVDYMFLQRPFSLPSHCKKFYGL